MINYYSQGIRFCGGLVLAGIKLGISGLSPYDLVSTSFGVWGVAVFADNVTRTAYMFIRKKPIGSIIYTEWPYRLGKYLFKKRKEKKLSEEAKNLNITDILNLS